MPSPDQASEVDNSLEAMTARLTALQEPLGQLMSKAMELFDEAHPRAPHPSDREKDFPVYAISTVDICRVERVPMGRELTVVLAAGRWVRAFRNSQGSPDAFPRERLWLWRVDGDNNRKTDVFKTHEPRRREIPYDIEIADYDDKGRCKGLVGAPYHENEQFIEEAEAAVDEARRVAHELGLATSGDQ